MAYRSDMQFALEDLVLRLALVRREPESQLKQSLASGDRVEASTAPDEAERWLRWMKVTFGCETG